MTARRKRVEVRVGLRWGWIVRTTTWRSFGPAALVSFGGQVPEWVRLANIADVREREREEDWLPPAARHHWE